MIVVAEGDEFGGANEVAKMVKERLPNSRYTGLYSGPYSTRRFAKLSRPADRQPDGISAVECLMEGRHNVMVGILNNKMHYTPLEKAVKAKQKISDEWMKIVKILASLS